MSHLHSNLRILAAAAMIVVGGAVRAEEPTAAQALMEPGFAELSLEQLMDVKVDSVYGASKYEQKISRAPASVSIVTSEEMKKLGHRTLADVLRSTRGFYVTNDRTYSFIGARGFSPKGDFSTRVLLLVDGHRMNDDMYGSAMAGREGFLDIDLIDRVEIVRGPSSSIYGSNAFFGVINVITKKAADIDGFEASGAVGSWDTYKARLTYGKQFENGLELLLSASFYGSAGQDELYFKEFDHPDTNNGIAVRSDDEYTANFYGRVRYHDLTLAGGYSHRQKNTPTGIYDGYFNDGREETTDEQYFVEAKYETTFGNDWRLSARAFYDYYAYRAIYPYNYNTPRSPFIALSKDDVFARSLGAEAQLTKKFFDKHTLILGTEYRRILDLVQANRTKGFPESDYHIASDAWWWSAYTQAEIALSKNLLLNAGIRYDHYSNFGDTVNPRIGLIYSPAKTSTIKLLYGQAFRAPNAFERDLEAPNYSIANPELQPETIRTYEAIFEQKLPHNLRLSVSGYYYETEDLISQIELPSGIYQYQNVSQATGKGIEVELEGRYARGLIARASYAIQRAENAETGEELVFSPRQMAKLSLIAPLYKESLYAGLDLQYYSGMQTLAGKRTSGFATANATLLSREVLPGLEISASVYNLFDTKYDHPASVGNVVDTVEQDGRSFWLKVNYKF